MSKTGKDNGSLLVTSRWLERLLWEARLALEEKILIALMKSDRRMKAS